MFLKQQHIYDIEIDWMERWWKFRLGRNFESWFYLSATAARTPLNPWTSSLGFHFHLGTNS